jgi:thiol-disulfide isomerase/thioredoxin
MYSVHKDRKDERIWCNKAETSSVCFISTQNGYRFNYRRHNSSKRRMNVTAYQFWSPTCEPCKLIKPIIEDLKEEFEAIRWVSVNTHDDKENYAERYSVSVVPTIVVVVGDWSDRHSGTTAAGYYRILRNAIRLSQQS